MNKRKSEEVALKAYRRAVAALGSSEDEAAVMLGLWVREWRALIKGRMDYPRDLGDRCSVVIEITQQLYHRLGNRTAAKIWLDSPNEAFSNVLPRTMLRTSYNRARVLMYLRQLTA